MTVTGKIGLVFSLIGTPILLGGLFWTYKSASYSMHAVSVKSAVVSVAQETCTRNEGDSKHRREVSYTCYRPTVTYEYASQAYTKALGETSSEPYTVGENFDLKVDPDHPKEASTNASLWFGPIFLSVFGLIFAGVGFGLLRSFYRRKAMESHLQTNGVRIRAKVLDVGLNESLTVNGRHPFMVSAQFNDPKTGQPVVAVLPELWYDPRLSGAIADDQTVEVIYDPLDAKRCMIELKPASKLQTAV